MGIEQQSAGAALSGIVAGSKCAAPTLARVLVPHKLAKLAQLRDRHHHEREAQGDDRRVAGDGVANALQPRSAVLEALLELRCNGCIDGNECKGCSIKCTGRSRRATIVPTVVSV